MRAPVRVGLIGQVGHDTLQLLPSGVVEQVFWVARQSLASQLGPADPDQVPPPALESPWQRAMVRADLAGSLVTTVEKHAPSLDLLLIDLADERYGLVLTPGAAVLTGSEEMRRSGLLDELGVAQALRMGSPEHLERFTEGLELLLAGLRRTGLLQRTLLLAPAFAEEPVPGSDTPRAELNWLRYEARELNRTCQDYLAQVEQRGVPVVRLGTELVRMDPQHPDGLSHLHYHQATYRALLGEIQERLPHLEGLRTDLAPDAEHDWTPGADDPVPADQPSAQERPDWTAGLPRLAADLDLLERPADEGTGPGQPSPDRAGLVPDEPAEERDLGGTSAVGPAPDDERPDESGLGEEPAERSDLALSQAQQSGLADKEPQPAPEPDKPEPDEPEPEADLRDADEPGEGAPQPLAPAAARAETVADQPAAAPAVVLLLHRSGAEPALTAEDLPPWVRVEPAAVAEQEPETTTGPANRLLELLVEAQVAPHRAVVVATEGLAVTAVVTASAVPQASVVVLPELVEHQAMGHRLGHVVAALRRRPELPPLVISTRRRSPYLQILWWLVSLYEDLSVEARLGTVAIEVVDQERAADRERALAAVVRVLEETPAHGLLLDGTRLRHPDQVTVLDGQSQWLLLPADIRHARVTVVTGENSPAARVRLALATAEPQPEAGEPGAVTGAGELDLPAGGGSSQTTISSTGSALLRAVGISRADAEEPLAVERVELEPLT